MIVVVDTLLEPCESVESRNNNVVNGTLEIEVLVLCTKERVIESNRRRESEGSRIVCDLIVLFLLGILALSFFS
jgi:hypothetical protein